MRFVRSHAITRKVIGLLFFLVFASALLYQTRVSHSNYSPQPDATSRKSPPVVSSENISGAEAKFAEAEKLRSQQTEESNRKAIANYVDAAYTWRNAGRLHDAAVAFRSAGDLLQLLGNSSSASFHYDEALVLAKKSKDKEQEGRILNDIAYLEFVSGNSKQAQQNSLKALAIANSLGNREIEADALSNLGEAFYSLGDLETAVEKQQQSLLIWRDLANQRGQAISHIALGYCYANLGEPEKANNSYRDGLALAQSAKDMGVEALAHVAMGNMRRKLGEKQEALDSYRNAQAIAERIGDKTSQAIVSAGIGTIHFDMGNGREALAFIERAVKLFELNEKTWGIAETKLDLGRIQHSLDNEPEALRNLSEALALFRSLSMRRLESLTLRALGQVHRKLGETESALRAYRQALKLTRVGQDQRQEAYTLNYIGELYEDLKQPDLALKYYRDALPLSRVSADPISEARSLYNMAHVERDRQNLDEANQHIKAAVKIVESLRTKVSSQDLRATYFATVRDVYELYINILMLLHKKNPSAGFDAGAFVVSERARARSFLELLRESRANVREGVDPALLAKESELSEAFDIKANRQMQLLAKKDKQAADQLEKELADLTAQLAQIRADIKSHSPRYAALTLPEPFNLREVQEKVLNDDTVLLEYALGIDRSYVWLVSRDSVVGYELPGRREIDQAARRLYELFISYQMVYGEPVDQQTERRTKAAAAMPAEIASLSKLVLGPLSGKLQNKRLIIIPDGALQYIPFQMLTDPDSPQILLANHEIVVEPSASTLGLLLSDNDERGQSRNSVAVLADPVFEADDPRLGRSANNNADSAPNEELKQALRDIGLSADGVQIPRLLASKEEADAIMNSVPWGTGLKAVGFAANRETVLSEKLKSYRVIHFATHGLINNEHPDLSGIVLSLFNQEGRSQNGFLRLHDIYNLRLPADLVVLSACSTGLGKDVRGEGLIGLTRGFMYAGASSVVASLWKVDDEATAELMKHFYHAMFQKRLAPVAALRDAQLVMSRSPRWQSPYYWAGFVIQGRYDKPVASNEIGLVTPGRVAVGVVLLVGLTLTIFLFLRRRRV